MNQENILHSHSADIITMTSTITAAYVSGNRVPATDLPELIKNVYTTLAQLGQPKVVEVQKQDPAVPIRKSVTPDYIVCLEDGKKLKMLKRHLRTTYGMSPEEYRAKWGLPPEYPMAAPNYAAQRSDLAKKIGLGRKPAKAQPEPAPNTALAARNRKKAA